MTASDRIEALVIGCGAGGAAVAWGLARRGIETLVLEAGPEYQPGQDYRLDRDDWETAGFPDKGGGGRYAHDVRARLDLARTDIRSWNHLRGFLNETGERQYSGYRHVRGVGGSTLHYSGEAHRLHPSAFDLKTRTGVGADWPITYGELEPFYIEAERLIGVAGPSNPEARWRSAPFPLPAHGLSYASRRLAGGARRLGFEWQANSLAALSAPYDGRPPCNYCGNCARGCPIGDKGSADVTFAAKARATGHCRIETGTTVLRIEAGPNDRVESVVYRTSDGKNGTLRPEIVILAGGAIETPRMLLLSENTHAPDGLGNEAGLVGRNFMETVSWTSIGLHPEPLGSHRGHPVDSICWDENAADAIPGIPGGARYAAGTAEADLLGPIAYATRIAGGWGRKHHARMRETFGRALGVGAIGACLPNAASYVGLDAHIRDAHGLPVARINSRLTNTDIARLAHMATRCRALLEASGVTERVEEYGTYDYFASTHVFGTCRMGEAPDMSVVDAFGRSHRWRNLFVADASVFPGTGGGEAPSLTIQALALRCAAHIAANRG